MSVRGDARSDAGHADSVDDVVRALVDLRAAAGSPSYATLASSVGRLRANSGRGGGRPGKVTVYDCFRSGRRRLDVDLVGDLLEVLGLERGERAALLSGLHSPPKQRRAETGTDVWLPVLRNPLLGRDEVMADLVASPPGSVRAVVGPPGVGKTELALHVAHRWNVAHGANAFALSVDLRGYDAERGPLCPHQVVGQLLRGVGVPVHRIDGLDSEARLAELVKAAGGRRLLLLLDNAASPDQIRLMLPEGHDGLVLVTSRRTLSCLDDVLTAPPTELDVLAPKAAVALLAHHVGIARVATEPDAANRIAERCGRVPLDLTVAAAVVAASPGWTLADHAARLEAQPGDELSRPALQLSYERLAPTTQLVLRYLALHPGRRVELGDVAALTGMSHHDVREQLDDLVREHLVVELGAGTFTLHDMVAAFARRLALGADPRSAQEAAFVRLGESLVAEIGERSPLGAVDVAWTSANEARLVAFCRAAPEWAAVDQAADVVRGLHEHLDVTGQLALAEDLLRGVIEAEPTSDVASLRGMLGRTLEQRGRPAEALHQYQLAESLSPDGSERNLNGMGNVLKRMGRYRQALGRYRRAATLAHARGNTFVHGRALGNLADTLRVLGHPTLALTQFVRARELSEAAGDRVNLGVMRHNEAFVAEELGDLATAIAHARAAMETLEEEGFSALAVSARSLVARYLLEDGDLAGAAAEAEHATREATGSELAELMCELQVLRARLSAALGDLEAAERELLEVLGNAERLGVALPAIEAHNRLGEVLAQRGRRRAAAASHRRAARLAHDAGDVRELARAKQALASLAIPTQMGMRRDAGVLGSV